MVENCFGTDKGIRILFKNGKMFRVWIMKSNYKELKSCPIQSRLKSLLMGDLNHNKKSSIGNRQASRSYIFRCTFEPNEFR